MKVLLLSMLLLLLCSTTVLTLQCYICTDESDTTCTTLVTCAAEEVYCRTITDDGQLMRSCEEFCDEDKSTTCCQRDGC